MGRRGESIYRRKDGRWEARILIEKGVDGSAKYRSVYARSYSDVKEKRRIAMLHAYVPQNKGCFSDVIAQWLCEKENEVKEQTIRKYKQCIDRHISPVFGKMKTNSITGDLIDKFLIEKRRSGRLDGTGGLSQNTVRGIAIVLQSLLDFAYYKKMGILKCYKMNSPYQHRHTSLFHPKQGRS